MPNDRVDANQTHCGSTSGRRRLAVLRSVGVAVLVVAAAGCSGSSGQPVAGPVSPVAASTSNSLLAPPTSSVPPPADSVVPSAPVTSPAAQPVSSDPASSDPASSDPASSDPGSSDPASSDPAASSPTTSAPLTDGLVGKPLQGNGFTTRIPTGWTRESAATGIVLQAADGGQLTMADPTPTTTTASALGAATARSLKSQGYVIKSGPSPTTMGAAPAFQLAALSGDGKAAVLVLAAVHGGALYDLSFGIAADLAGSTPDTDGLSQIQQFWGWSAAATMSPSPSPTNPTAHGRLGCPSGAAVCDSFDKSATGWKSFNTADAYGGYDAYHGGTYRIGTRKAGTAVAGSPHDITGVSAEYGVRVDADVATTAATNGQDPGVGLTCWNAKVSGDAAGSYAFIVRSSKAEIVWFDSSGAGVIIASTALPSGVVKVSPVGSVAWNHLQITCTQTGAGHANLTLKVNGRATFNLDPTTSAAAQGQAVVVGPGIGVLASGAGTDAFYDNLAVTRAGPQG